jgi:hypothetical protein
MAISDLEAIKAIERCLFNAPRSLDLIGQPYARDAGRPLGAMRVARQRGQRSRLDVNLACPGKRPCRREQRGGTSDRVPARPA